MMHGTVSVLPTRTSTMAGAIVEKPPKTDAGRRTVAVPHTILLDLTEHLSAHVDPEPDALMFLVSAAALRHAWDRVRATIGRNDLRLHDYADVRVMPTFPRTSSSPVVSVRKLSA